MFENHPKVRSDLHFQHAHHEGAKIVVIQDPLGIMPNPIGVSEMFAHVLPLMDGTRGVEDIEALFEEVMPGQIPAGLIQEGIHGLEQAGVFEDADYWRMRREVLDNYARQEIRSPSHAGLAYEGDPQDLSTWMDSILSGPNGDLDGPPRFIAAPHIDFRVNTSVYAKAYRPLRGHHYDRVVLMGTGHSVMEGIYCLTSKNLATPLGVTPNDRVSIEHLRKAGGNLIAPDDFPHRDEHALEFQMIFLQHLLGADSFEVVPILCGSVDRFEMDCSRLGEAAEMRPFLNELREIIHEEGKQTLVVAGVDLSHIGLRFSHLMTAAEMLEDTRRHDHDLLEAFTRWDAEAFWRKEQESGGQFNVCGFSTLSTILEVLDPGSAKCLAYDVWDDSPTGSAVTFAAVVAQGFGSTHT